MKEIGTDINVFNYMKKEQPSVKMLKVAGTNAKLIKQK